jgi:hypothetical protein
MSFIYDDPNLIDQLVIRGLLHEVKFSKKGQAAAAAADQDRANLMALVNNLQAQLSQPAAAQDPNAGPTISHEGGSAEKPSLGSQQLESLGDLIKWLQDNKITVDGTRVAYDTDPGNDDYMPYRLGTHVAGPEERGKAPDRFYVHPTALKQFFVWLQAYENKQPNRFMQVQVGKLIQDANQQLGANINPTYQPPEKALPDATVLDTVPDQFVNVQSSGYGGNIPLTYGDMKDITSFNKWLSDHAITFRTVMKDDKGTDKPVDVSSTNPLFNRAAVLKILVARANAKMQTATDPAVRETASIYARQAGRLVSQAGATTAPGSSTGQSGQAPTGDPAAAQAVNHIVQSMSNGPLTLQSVDFNKISSFLNQVKAFMGDNPTVAQVTENTQQLMDQISSQTTSQYKVFQLGVNQQAIANMFPDHKIPANFGATLAQIVNNVRDVILAFFSDNSQRISPANRDDIYAQIGERPGEDSIYARNIKYLANYTSIPATPL